jgi:hypothetical protein
MAFLLPHDKFSIIDRTVEVFQPPATIADPPNSVFVEVEDFWIVHILGFGGIDEDDFSRRTVWVWQVGIPVLDHGSIRGFDNGFVELVLDFVEFGVSHTEALLGNSIIGIHQAR